MGLARLISTLQGQAVKAGGSISFETAQKSPELEAIRPVLVAQKIESLIAVPMMDREEHIGIVILEQCAAKRRFRKVDEVVLNTIAEQIVLAVNNARLRSLVKTLAVTDEKSGLLRRSSYLDVLLSEVRRSLPQKSPVTIVLMSFGSASALVKEVGEPTVEAAMQEVGHAVTANIRQNDLAVRYSLTNIALILSDTNDKSAFFALDKLRKTTANVRIPGHAEPVVMTAGIAELVMNPKYDAVDIVTEAINRVEGALEIAKHEGGNRAHAMAPMFEVSAVSA
jgi:diguanylate cyclase (GGDEF)-like protein